MGACGSKAQALASESGSRMSRAFSSGETAVGHARPRKGRAQRFQDTREFALGLPQEEEARERGMYLVFDTASGGALHAVWSETAVEGAWAFFFPRKTVPAFKFKGNGRTELIRDLMVNRAKLFSGWTQFFKLAHDNDGLVQIYTERESDFWYMDKDLGVHFIERNTWYESRDMAVVAILPRHNLSLKGVQKTSVDVFHDTVISNSGTTWRPLS